jgi:hypothetical protein
LVRLARTPLTQASVTITHAPRSDKSGQPRIVAGIRRTSVPADGREVTARITIGALGCRIAPLPTNARLAAIFWIVADDFETGQNLNRPHIARVSCTISRLLLVARTAVEQGKRVAWTPELSYHSTDRNLLAPGQH